MFVSLCVSMRVQVCVCVFLYKFMCKGNNTNFISRLKTIFLVLTTLVDSDNVLWVRLAFIFFDKLLGNVLNL